MVVKLNSASDTLKNLYVYRDGENKGFLALMNKQKLDSEYEKVFLELFKRTVDEVVFDLVNELNALCVGKDIDADVKSVVNQLVNAVNVGGANE